MGLSASGLKPIESGSVSHGSASALCCITSSCSGLGLGDATGLPCPCVSRVSLGPRSSLPGRPGPELPPGCRTGGPRPCPCGRGTGSYTEAGGGAVCEVRRAPGSCREDGEVERGDTALLSSQGRPCVWVRGQQVGAAKGDEGYTLCSRGESRSPMTDRVRRQHAAPTEWADRGSCGLN